MNQHAIIFKMMRNSKLIHKRKTLLFDRRTRIDFVKLYFSLNLKIREFHFNDMFSTDLKLKKNVSYSK